MEMEPAEVFEIILTMVNGLTRDAPLVVRVVKPSSNSDRPPMPVPMMTPNWKGSIDATSMPESLIAWSAPTTANWETRSSRRASLVSRTPAKEKSLTSPPNLTL